MHAGQLDLGSPWSQFEEQVICLSHFQIYQQKKKFLKNSYVLKLFAANLIVVEDSVYNVFHFDVLGPNRPST